MSRKTIPKEYMFKGSYEKSGYRKYSPFHIDIKNDLYKIPCPQCGEFELRNMEFDGEHDEPVYCVGCDNCDFVCPDGDSLDNGDAISNFEDWLEAFYLLGKPKNRLKEDLELLFYPKQWRDKLIECFEEENKNKVSLLHIDNDDEDDE